MKVIVFLDGTESLSAATLDALRAADMVIDVNGEVVENKRGEKGYRINLLETNRALHTKARPRKTGSAE